MGELDPFTGKCKCGGDWLGNTIHGDPSNHSNGTPARWVITDRDGDPHYYSQPQTGPDCLIPMDLEGKPLEWYHVDDNASVPDDNASVPPDNDDDDIAVFL